MATAVAPGVDFRRVAIREANLCSLALLAVLGKSYVVPFTISGYKVTRKNRST